VIVIKNFDYDPAENSGFVQNLPIKPWNNPNNRSSLAVLFAIKSFDFSLIFFIHHAISLNFSGTYGESAISGTMCECRRCMT